MTISRTSQLKPSGRIRLDDLSSQELLILLDKELKVANRHREECSDRKLDAMTNHYNRYMRRVRRMIHETERMRVEMGWEPVELSELAARE